MEKRPGERPLVDRMLGGLGVALIVAGLVATVRAVAAPGPGGAAGPPPTLTLVSPPDGATVGRPVSVVFRSAAPLRPTDMGWGAAGLHLHLGIDDASVMPGAGEVAALPGGEYRWTVPALGPGRHVLRLAWSDASHRPVSRGSSRAVRVTVR